MYKDAADVHKKQGLPAPSPEPFLRKGPSISGSLNYDGKGGSGGGASMNTEVTLKKN